MARKSNETQEQEPKSWAQKGTKEGEERFNFIAKSQHIEDLKNIAYWERERYYKTIIDKAFTHFIEAWKADKGNKAHIAGGKIKQRPDGK